MVSQLAKGQGLNINMVQVYNCRENYIF
jgi:hypothetical protein